MAKRMTKEIAQSREQWAIEHASQEAVTTISTAANEAVHVIAQAASEAAKVVSAAAAAAAAAQDLGKVGGNDHDTIVTLVAGVANLDKKIDGLKSDIKEINTGTATRIHDLETGKLDTKDAYPAMYKAGVETWLKNLQDQTNSNTVNITRILAAVSVLTFLTGVGLTLLAIYKH
jgi:hypothetical protein